MPRLSLLVLSLIITASVLAACDSGNEPEVDIEDLVVGEGLEAEGRDIVTIEYVGMLEDSVEFDSSEEWGPLQFQLDSGIIYGLPEGESGRIIEGLTQGVPGMKIGGLRRITIPPELAYGRSGVPGAIPPNATLIFEVELVDVEKADESDA